MERWKGGDKIPPEYKPIANAYAWVELIIDGECDGINPWQTLTKGGHRNPAVVVAILKQVAEGTANNPPEEDADNTEAVASLRKAVTQMDLPLFLTYIAGKMGAV